MVDPDYYAGRRVPNNGFQAMVRALEISMQEHARLLLRDADLVLRPRFFGARQHVRIRAQTNRCGCRRPRGEAVIAPCEGTTERR